MKGLSTENTAKLTSKGQIPVPKPIRERLNILPGDRIHFFIADDGTITFMPVKSDVQGVEGNLAQTQATGVRGSDECGNRRRRERTMIGLDTNVLDAMALTISTP